jgi:hypothetical protein
MFINSLTDLLFVKIKTIYLTSGVQDEHSTRVAEWWKSKREEDTQPHGNVTQTRKKPVLRLGRERESTLMEHAGLTCSS